MADVRRYFQDALNDSKKQYSAWIEDMRDDIKRLPVDQIKAIRQVCLDELGRRRSN